jgi:hypothetical protein
MSKMKSKFPHKISFKRVSFSLLKDLSAIKMKKKTIMRTSANPEFKIDILSLYFFIELLN